MLKTSEETEAYQTYLENRILNKNELYILNQNIKTSEAIQEIVWKKQTCKCESVYENLEPKRPTLWTFRGPAATRRGESFWLSYKERRVDALALRADERRDKLRKASGRSKYPLIRRYLNGETRLSKPQSLHGESIAMQREPGELKHLSSRRKRKKHRFPK